MTAQELEGTRLIAEYMGWRYAGMARPGLFSKKAAYFKRNKGEGQSFITTFNYVNSWGAQIPVWEKCHAEMMLLSMRGGTDVTPIPAIKAQFFQAINSNYPFSGFCALCNCIRYISENRRVK